MSFHLNRSVGHKTNYYVLKMAVKCVGQHNSIDWGDKRTDSFRTFEGYCLFLLWKIFSWVSLRLSSAESSNSAKQNWLRNQRNVVQRCVQKVPHINLKWIRSFGICFNFKFGDNCPPSQKKKRRSISSVKEAFQQFILLGFLVFISDKGS